MLRFKEEDADTHIKSRRNRGIIIERNVLSKSKSKFNKEDFSL